MRLLIIFIVSILLFSCKQPTIKEVEEVVMVNLTIEKLVGTWIEKYNNTKAIYNKNYSCKFGINKQTLSNCTFSIQDDTIIIDYGTGVIHRHQVLRIDNNSFDVYANSIKTVKLEYIRQ